jgi:superfamily II DNA/RNA helicase
LHSFHDFGLAEPITRALSEEKYITPTPIQIQTIPIALSHRDVIGIAQTGTGKTAAFALPILHQISANRHRPERKTCRVLVLSPTRELSGQILDSFLAYGRHLRISAALAIGGVPMGQQVRALSHGVEVLVATPGRLLDLVGSNALRLSNVEFLVLDEADRMLDMGFIHDIRKIIAKIPANRQTLFFSATMPSAISELADQMLRDPVKIAVAPAASTVERVEQRVIRVDRAAKTAVLAEVLKQETVDRALVFTRTKHGADKVVRNLVKAGIAAEAIHGNKSQNQRDRVLAAFRKGSIRTLVATDIAARGIDVDGISHVVNFDLPNVPETYVHRIGRTARAGAEGIAISLCDADEAPFLRDIERLIRMTIPATDRRTTRETPQPIQHGRGSRSSGANQANQGQAHRGGARRKHGQQQQGQQQQGPRKQGQNNQGQHRPQRDADRPIASVAFLNRGAEGRKPQRPAPAAIGVFARRTGEKSVHPLKPRDRHVAGPFATPRPR